MLKYFLLACFVLLTWYRCRWLIPDDCFVLSDLKKRDVFHLGKVLLSDDVFTSDGASFYQMFLKNTEFSNSKLKRKKE